jgi:LPS O-antigen subunit length determinant protein (WzzB/FepE family)
MAGLNDQRIAKRMELEYTRSFATGDEASARQLASQLSVVDEQLRDLEETRASPGPAAPRGTGPARGGKGMFPAVVAVPKLRADLEKLHRDRRVAEATLVFALERLESARASEARDVSTFQALDPPTLPTQSARPRKLEVLLGWAVVGLVGAVAFEWYRSLARSRRGEPPGATGDAMPSAGAR